MSYDSMTNPDPSELVAALESAAADLDDVLCDTIFAGRPEGTAKLTRAREAIRAAHAMALELVGPQPQSTRYFPHWRR